LIAKLRENPQNYIAQEQVKISQAPAWSAHHKPNLNSLAIGLRVYACATPNGYSIMPGGLARIASGKDERVITMQRGGTSKDTWITSPHATYHSSLLRRTMSSKDLVRGNTYLSSRMVENLFWFGRYTIRNAHTTRLIRIAIQFLMEFSGEHRPMEWTTLHNLCVWYGLMPGTDSEQSAADAPMQPEMLSDEEIERLLIQAVFSSKDHSLQSSIHQFSSWHSIFASVYPVITGVLSTRCRNALPIVNTCPG